jgi:hypothetical protein
MQQFPSIEAFLFNSNAQQRSFQIKVKNSLKCHFVQVIDEASKEFFISRSTLKKLGIKRDATLGDKTEIIHRQHVLVQ